MKYLGIIVLLLVIFYSVGHVVSRQSQQLGQDSLKQKMVFAARKFHVVIGAVAVVIVVFYFVRLLIHMIQPW
ncbi:MAG: hypothetical protein QG577_425 [Thermodesulfobacteriota bacterium]|nr:hypothetical protein [Thermodesulfobacteriota bacterium]